MDKEIKKQLILSTIILFFVIITMIFWYDNFIFHTFIKQVDYQYCFSGENDDVLVEGYEIFQNSHKAYSGNARLLSTQNNFFLKGDQIECTVTIKDQQNHTYQWTNQYQVQSSNEVCYFQQKEDMKKTHQLEITTAQMQLIVKRKNKVVYDNQIPLNPNELTVYNGSNKDYSIQNVYVGDSWLKTGYFSSTIENLSQQYPKCIIDYVCSNKDDPNHDVNNYEPIVHISGDTSTILKNERQETCFYDQEGKLSQKELKCVISLFKSDEDQNPLTFVIDLHGAMKAGGLNE